MLARLTREWLDELYSSPDNLSHETLLGMEGFLGNNMCFVNGFRSPPERCSMCSYGTILQYKQLSECLNQIGKDKLTNEKWRRIVKYFRYYWYLSPISGMVAAEIARFAGLPDPLNKDDQTNEFYC